MDLVLCLILRWIHCIHLSRQRGRGMTMDIGVFVSVLPNNYRASQPSHIVGMCQYIHTVHSTYLEVADQAPTLSFRSINST
jgi:hypothetical protein